MHDSGQFPQSYSYGGSGDHEQRLPPAARTMGMWLLLISLSVFFFGALFAFLFIRTRGAHSPPPGTLHIPAGLWYSTAFLLACSAALHVALRNVRREQQGRFRAWLIAAAVFSLAFLVAQAVSLPQLLTDHAETAGLKESYGIYGFLWALVVVHAVHVMIGLVPLGVTTVRGLGGRYDHEAYLGVKHCAMYWHFLDVVWLAMFGVFLMTA